MRQSSRQSSSLGKHLEDCIKACRGALQPVAPTVLDGSHLTRSGKQQMDPTACVLQHVQLELKTWRQEAGVAPSGLLLPRLARVCRRQCQGPGTTGPATQSAAAAIGHAVYIQC